MLRPEENAMKKFLRIGDRFINLSNVPMVEFTDPQPKGPNVMVRLLGVGGRPIMLTVPRAAAEALMAMLYDDSMDLKEARAELRFKDSIEPPGSSS